MNVATVLRINLVEPEKGSFSSCLVQQFQKDACQVMEWGETCMGMLCLHLRLLGVQVKTVSS